MNNITMCAVSIKLYRLNRQISGKFLFVSMAFPPWTLIHCYHGNKSVATSKKGIFVHPPWVPNCMQNLKEGWKFSFPNLFDSYRDAFLTIAMLIRGLKYKLNYYIGTQHLDGDCFHEW